MNRTTSTVLCFFLLLMSIPSSAEWASSPHRKPHQITGGYVYGSNQKHGGEFSYLYLAGTRSRIGVVLGGADRLFFTELEYLYSTPRDLFFAFGIGPRNVGNRWTPQTTVSAGGIVVPLFPFARFHKTEGVEVGVMLKTLLGGFD